MFVTFAFPPHVFAQLTVSDVLTEVRECPAWVSFVGLQPASPRWNDRFAVVLHVMRELSGTDTGTLLSAVRVLDRRTRQGTLESREFLRSLGITNDGLSSPGSSVVTAVVSAEKDLDKVVFLSRCLFACPRFGPADFAEEEAPIRATGKVDTLWPLDLKGGRMVLVGLPYTGPRGGACEDFLQLEHFEYAASHWRRRRWPANSDVPRN